MTERIQQLINDKKLSATQFSDEIGIQRSSLSHVLSGRNKPSLDFMLKIKTRFPDVNLDWLLLGEGQMYKEEKDTEDRIIDLAGEVNNEEKKNEQENVLNVEEPVKEGFGGYMARRERVDLPGGQDTLEKEIRQLILIYKDNTFTTLFPDKK